MSQIKHLLSEILARKSQTKAIGKALSISVINQVVSSGTNFLLALYLVRVLSTADFGLYGIGFAITLLFAGAGDALFLTQMVVHIPDKSSEDKLPYAASIFVSLILFCTISAIISIGLLFLFGIWSQAIVQYLGLGLSIIATSVAYLIKDFFIRHSYSARKEIFALWVNVAVTITLVFMLLLQSHWLANFNSEWALWFYAASNFAGAFVGFVLVRLPIFESSWQSIIEDIQEAWHGGRWALVGVGVTWSQTQAYMYVTAFFVGPVGVGLANAARILITPALFLMPVITQLVMPRLATLRATNQSKMFEISMLISMGLVCIAIVYSLLLLFFGETLAHILISRYRYSDIEPLAISWCLLLIFQLSRVGTVICLQVIKKFRLLTLINAASLVAALLIAVLLMKLIGIQGAILGSAGGELIFSVLIYRAAMQQFKSNPRSI